MKKTITLILVLLSQVSFSQNLVPNPSFEDTVSCPNFANQVNKAVGWHSGGGSPDYFNGCNWMVGSTSVPSNAAGYQYAHSGVAYCGFIGYSMTFPNAREYISCQLLSPLTVGTKYIVSFYVSLADAFSALGCNKLGMLLSTVNYTSSLSAPIGNFSQFYSDSLINDTLNWIKLSGSFIADTAFTHLTIGNFFDDAHTDTINSGPPFATYAYYYIDDISIIEDTTTSISELSLNDNAIIYPNPVRDILKIKDKNKSLLKIEITNSLGQVLIACSAKGNEEYDILMNQLPQGAYNLKIYYKNKKTTYHKLLKL